jgi:alanyl aminopeptidase
LLADLKALAWSGGKLSPLLDASEALKTDRDLLVVTQLTDAMVELATLAGPAERTALSAWVRRRLGLLATKLSWTPVAGETPERSVLRAKVLDTLDRVGHDPAVAAEAARRVDAAAKGNGALDPTLRATLLNIAARHGDEALWNNFEAERAATNDPQLREAYLRALMAFQKPALVQRALAATLTNAVPAQDLGLAFEVSMSADETRPAALRFLEDNFAAIAARLNANARRTLLGSLGKACSASDRDALAAMVKAHPIAGNERPIDRALETIEVCARAKPRLNAELSAWLRAHP